VVEGISREKDAEYIVVMDADLQHPPEILPSILDALQRHDFVAASRYIDGGGCKNWGLKRRVISKVSNLMAMPLVGNKVHDIPSGFFGFRNNGGIPGFKQNELDGFKIMLELLARGNWDSIAEIPYTFETRKYGVSKLSSSQMIDYLWQLMRLYKSKIVNQPGMLNFMFVGGIGYIINMVAYWLLLHVAKQNETVILGQHYYVWPFAISSFIAIASNYQFNKRWTFKRYKEQSVGFVRYLSMATATFFVDLLLLITMVDVFSMPPTLAVALAIAVTFLIRYTIAKRWIWKQKESQ
jgi:dolichol-phosphate mannosyltransferase